MSAREWKLDELCFIRRHFQVDMSPLQFAVYFACSQEDILEAAKRMKLKITAGNIRMTKFHTPYPCQIAQSVQKANVPQPNSGNPDYGENQIRSPDPH